MLSGRRLVVFGFQEILLQILLLSIVKKLPVLFDLADHNVIGKFISTGTRIEHAYLLQYVI